VKLFGKQGNKFINITKEKTSMMLVFLL